MVHVSPAGRRPRGLVGPNPLRGRLPDVSIPLASWEPEVPLDLHARIDNRREPVPPLDAEDAAWAHAIRVEKGRR